jgi:hypothetical protein
MASGQAQHPAQGDLAEYLQRGKATGTSYVDRTLKPLQSMRDVSTDDVRKTRSLYRDRNTVRMISRLGHSKCIRSRGQSPGEVSKACQTIS